MGFLPFWMEVTSAVAVSYQMYRGVLYMKKEIDNLRARKYWTIEVGRERQNAYRSRINDRRIVQLLAIEAKAAPQQVLYPDRPYGLPTHFHESGQEDIWRHILEFVDEPKDIISLVEVCPIFRHILKRKYIAVRLPEVFKISLDQMKGKRNGHSQRFTDELLPLRLLCKMTRNSVDDQLMKNRLHRIDYTDYFHRISCINPTFYGIFFFPADNPLIHMEPDLKDLIPDFPLLDDFLKGCDRQTRLQSFVTSLEERNGQGDDQAVVPLGITLPLKDVYLNEVQVVDLVGLRGLFEKFFTIAGGSIRYFFYNCELTSHETYSNLRKWVPLLPKLEELRVARMGQDPFAYEEFPPFGVILEPFPNMPKLLSFREMCKGFEVRHLFEILRSTPTINHIDLCHFPRGRLDALGCTRVEACLHPLPLKVLNCGQVIPKSFLQQDFNWPLRTIILDLLEIDISRNEFQTMVDFVNKFGKTLKELLVQFAAEDPGPGRMLHLPNLTMLRWCLYKNQDYLNFINPLKSLEVLELNTKHRWQWDDEGFRSKEEALAFVRKNHVEPLFFPALKRISAAVKVGLNFRWEDIWTRSDAVYWQNNAQAEDGFNMD